jgi:hypothetical protein
VLRVDCLLRSRIRRTCPACSRSSGYNPRRWPCDSPPRTRESPLRRMRSASSWERRYSGDQIAGSKPRFLLARGSVGAHCAFSEYAWIASMPLPVRTYRPVPFTFWIRPSRVKRSNVSGSTG